MFRGPACHTLPKALDVSIATAWVAPDLFKDPLMFLKIYIWLRQPKTILEIRKWTTFLQVINNLIIYEFSKDFTKHRKKTNRAKAFSCRFFPNIVKYRAHQLNLIVVGFLLFYVEYICSEATQSSCFAHSLIHFNSSLNVIPSIYEILHLPFCSFTTPLTFFSDCHSL